MSERFSTKPGSINEFPGGPVNRNGGMYIPDPLDSSSELIRVIDALGEVNVLGDWPVVREALQSVRAAIAIAKSTQTQKSPSLNK